MYLQIKKTDSVTSILMFLFNVFLVPMGIREITIKNILCLLKPFDKSETSIRMGLSRGVRNGVLINTKRQGDVCYSLTSSAEDYFRYWWEIMQQFHTRIPMQHNSWDEIWTLVHIRGDNIEEIISLLKKQGFGSLNRTLWISPYDIVTQRPETIEKLADNVYVFRSMLKNLQPKEIIRDTWNPAKLNSSYKKFVDELEITTDKLEGENGQGLPVLHLFGLRLFGIIQEDPQLPLELLPKDWMGIEAVQKFEKIREQLLPQAIAYIKYILK